MHDAIKSAIDLVDGAFHLFNFLYTLALDALQAAVSVITQEINNIAAWIDTVDASIWGWINGLISDFYHGVLLPIFDGIRSVYDAAVAELRSLYASVVGALDWVVANVIDPVVTWVENAPGIVGGWIADGWNTFYANVVAPLIATAQMYYHEIDQIWDFVWHVAYDIIALCIKAEEWLILFAEHPVSSLEGLAHDVTSTTTLQWVVNTAKGADQQVENLADTFAQWLGE